MDYLTIILAAVLGGNPALDAKSLEWTINGKPVGDKHMQTTKVQKGNNEVCLKAKGYKKQCRTQPIMTSDSKIKIELIKE